MSQETPGQVWDRIVGSQGTEEFMRCSGPIEIEAAVREYIEEMIDGGDFDEARDDAEEVIAALTEKIYNDRRNALIFASNGAPRGDGEIWDAITFNATVGAFLDAEPNQDTTEATARTYVAGLSHPSRLGTLGRFDARATEAIVGAMLRVIEDAGVTS